MALSPKLVDDPTFFPILQRVVDCVCTALAEAGGPGFCFCGPWIGSGPPPLGLMNCEGGDCGVAWVRPVRRFPSTAFPSPDFETGISDGASPHALELEVGVARCYPRAPGRQAFPDPQAVFDAVRLIMSDMHAVKQALLCCFPRSERERRLSLGEWTPLEQAAGASGGTWTVTVA